MGGKLFEILKKKIFENIFPKKNICFQKKRKMLFFKKIKFLFIGSKKIVFSKKKCFFVKN